MSPIYVPGKVTLAKDYTEGDRYFNETSLLLHGNADGSGNILDSSPSPKTITKFGDAASATPPSYPNGNSAFGNAVSFDGNGDYIRAADNSDFAFGTGDFTAELWAYWTGSGSQYFIDTRTGTGTGFPWLTDFIGPSAAGYSASWPTNEWFHAAVARQSGSLRIFKNGTLVTTLSDGNNYTSTGMYIGARYTAQNLWSGYIDDLRITKGVARYTANFTPPTAPFADGYY